MSWRPAGRKTPILDRLDLRIEAGEKVLLVGPSGSGKSTLLRAIAGLLLTADVGELAGRVSIAGSPPQDSPGQVGLLLQDPTAGLVAGTVGRDVAFGLENTGVPRPEMPHRVRRALEAASFHYGEGRRVDTLSGGETQRLALAGALVMHPRVLLLDEPTSMLDEESSARVREAVLGSVHATGSTLVVVEHRLGPWVPHMDRCVVLDPAGRVVADGPPGPLLRGDRAALASQGVWVPGMAVPEPLAVDPSLVAPQDPAPGDEPIVVADDVRVVHRSPFRDVGSRGHRRPALDGVSGELRAGRGLGLTGPSGAGKSTLLAVLAGLQHPDSGSCRIREEWSGHKGRSASRLSSSELARRLAWVPQTPEHGLVRGTVIDELMLTSTALGLSRGAAMARARGLLEVLGLSALADTNAHRLSGGEQRRLVVAAALVHGPAGVLLDEPTVGQDRLTWSAVTGVCATARAAGAGIAVATHDVAALDVLAGDGRGSVLRLDQGLVVGGVTP